MQDFPEWSLNLISSNKTLEGLEERYFEVVLLIEPMLPKLLKGEPLLLFSDKKREWFVEYILIQINQKDRPFIPIYKLSGILNTNQLFGKDRGKIEDMLSISFPNGYNFWFIGEKELDFSNGFFWEIKEKSLLDPKDPNLDIKLLQLYKIFESSIEGAIFGEFEIF
jgi:hypothetical protein